MRSITTHRTAPNILLPEVLRRGRLTLLALLFTLVLAACGKPVPADKQAYVGTWESATTSLLIDASGRVERVQQAARRVDGRAQAQQAAQAEQVVQPRAQR